MALAFFTAPITTLGSFGFGKPAAPGRPESMSAGAVIKCSDCGGDVVLAELGEHVCNSPNPEEADEEDEVVVETPSTPKAEKTLDTNQSTESDATSDAIAALKARLAKSIQPEIKSTEAKPTVIKPAEIKPTETKKTETKPTEITPTQTKPAEIKPTDNSSSRSSSITMSPPSRKNSSSDFSFSNSEASSSSVSSTGRTPFFEKYAQLMPTTAKIQPKPTPKITGQGRDRLKLSSKKALSPITSPELSPREKSIKDSRSTREKLTTSKSTPKIAEVSHSSKDKLPTSRSTPLSNLPELGLASQRREAANRRLRKEQNLVTSTSEPNALDKLRRAQQEPSSRNANLTNQQKTEPKVSSSRAPTKDRWKERAADGGLEDLMGDLMAEMEKKAEQSSEEYRNTMSRRAPVRPSVCVPENPTGRLNSGPKVDESAGRRVKPEVYPGNPPKLYSRPTTGSDPSNDSPTPSSPGIKPSDSISQLGYRSPSPKLVRGLQIPTQNSAQRCQRCGESPIRHVKNPTTDEARFCRQCYAELYLPKCRKCAKPIERGAVTDRVGKVLGKYHSNCFNCFQCSAPFPNGEFYVWERKPVCFKHYHRLAGTTCCNESCGQGIEGPCVSLILEGSSVGSALSDDSSQSNAISNSARRKLYHPEHFTCSRRGCPNSLHEFHFVLNGQPWCEHHALQEQDQLPRIMRQNRLPSRGELPPYGRGPPPSHPPDRSRRVERRRTVIQNVRNH